MQNLFLLFLTFFTFVSAEIRLEVIKGRACEPYVIEMTQLGLIVFKEYPYLYEGTLEECLPSLNHYTHFDRSLTLLVYDEETLIGYAIGLPMTEMRNRYKLPYSTARPDDDMQDLFYLGEIVLLKEYRGQGIGKKMVQTFEKEARALNFKRFAFCKNVEETTLPIGYTPLDSFWTKLGYHECSDIVFTVDWKVIGDEEDTFHEMVFWIK